MRSLLISTLIVAASFFSNGAVASLVTFDFSGDGGLLGGASSVFSSSGYTVTATAGAEFSSDAYDTDVQLGQYSGGLGVTSTYWTSEIERVRGQCLRSFFGFCLRWDYTDVENPVLHTDAGGILDLGHELDNSGPDESISLDFGMDVTLVSATITFLDIYNDEVLLNDFDLPFQLESLEELAAGVLGLAEKTIPIPTDQMAKGSMFVFGTPEGDGVGYKLKEVVVEYDDSPQPADPIPEPMTLALIGVGLVGIGYGARHRKAA